MSAAGPTWLPRRAVPEALAVWALCFGAIVITYAIPVTRPAAKLVATVGFLYLPLWAVAARDEDFPDYGLNLRTWRTDVKLFLAVAAIVFPLYVLGYFLAMRALPALPAEWVHRLTPFAGTPHFQLRLPARFGEWVIDQYFVVAVPEEFFYRGYLLTRLRDAWPGGRVFLGVRLGGAFWLTAVLFALGHLAILEAWRPWVFVPALLFAWLRERTGSILGAALLHGSANLLEKVLFASFFGV